MGDDEEVININITSTISDNPHMYRDLPEESKTREVTEEVVRSDGFLLRYAPEALRNDKGIVETAVEESGECLEYASYEMKANKDVITKALASSALAIEFVPRGLREDPDVIRTGAYQLIEEVKGGCLLFFNAVMECSSSEEKRVIDPLLEYTTEILEQSINAVSETVVAMVENKAAPPYSESTQRLIRMAMQTIDLTEPCSICLSPLETIETVGGLACGHFAHKQCLVQSLRSMARCPVCREMAPRDPCGSTK
jgi:hypothetical protein